MCIETQTENKHKVVDMYLQFQNPSFYYMWNFDKNEFDFFLFLLTQLCIDVKAINSVLSFSKYTDRK